jgi:hypothetical protein
VKIVKLKDETTGFHDPETGFKVVRGQEIRMGRRVGKLTARAIAQGRLIEVRGDAANAEEESRAARKRGKEGKGSRQNTLDSSQ